MINSNIKSPYFVLFHVRDTNSEDAALDVIRIGILSMKLVHYVKLSKQLGAKFWCILIIESN